ncbi:MAG: hypothetical protein WBD31_03745 [Rubripirellula sp.]
MSDHLRIDVNISFKQVNRGARVATEEKAVEVNVPGRLPKVTKLMALAIRFERLLASGAAADYAELARLGHVTRARLTQIMNLRLLAPDIQEAILFLPAIRSGRDPIILRDLQAIALTANWRQQRRLWKRLVADGPNVSSGSG